MALGELYLGVDVGSLELLSAFGREFSVVNKKISRIERTASGRLVEDIIATKKEFTLAYNLIDGDDLDTYKDLYDEEDELLFRVYTGVSTYDNYTVLMEPLNYERILMFDNGLWGNVDILLVEV